MKVSVLQESLAHGLSIVSRAVSSRSTLPVLSNILLATDEGRLRLSATNLELGIICWIGAKIEEEGATTVPARIFNDLINTLEGQQQIELSLTLRTQTLNIRSKASNTNIKCIDATEFPPMPTIDINDGISLPISTFKEMIQQVVFASSNDEARPVLTGVFVKGEGRKISLSAADGFRLSRSSTELLESLPEPISAIIPARTLSELARIVSDGEQTMNMQIPSERNQVIFTVGPSEEIQGIQVISQLIEGTYPNVDQVIPKSYQTRAILSTSGLLKACRQAEIFARQSNNIVRLNILPGSDENMGKVEISGQSDESGSHQTEMEATIEGNPLLIAFNVRFLREALEVIKTPNLVLETTANTSPGAIYQAGDTSFVHVIMPMHLGN